MHAHYANNDYDHFNSHISFSIHTEPEFIIIVLLVNSQTAKLNTPLISDYDDASSTRALLPQLAGESATAVIPLPTLYNNGNSTAHGHAPLSHAHSSGPGSGRMAGPPMVGGRRMGAIEFLLYNMSSMLASVAAGYDVRLSNVTPIHPKLHPKM